MLKLPPRVTSSVEMAQEFGGQVFADGIYRVMSSDMQALAKTNLMVAFGEAAQNLEPFSSDWLGRIFSVRETDRTVLLAEPGTAELLETQVDLHKFHNTELREHADAALAEPFYLEWRAAGNPAPRLDQCVSYRTPLFLGGSDTLDNLELNDMDVYWSIVAQIMQKLTLEKST